MFHTFKFDRSDFQKLASNKFATLAIALLGSTQVIFWFYCASFPPALLNFVDATFMAQFYFKLVGKAIVVAVATSIYLLPILLFFRYAPIQVYRRSVVRKVHRKVKNNFLEIRFLLFMMGFWIALSGAYLPITFLIVFSALKQAQVFWIKFTMKKAAADRQIVEGITRETRDYLGGEVNSSEINDFDKKLRKAGVLGKKMGRRYRGYLRDLALVPIYRITALTIFFAVLGISHAWEQTKNGPRITLTDAELSGPIIGTTAKYLILFDRASDKVIAVPALDYGIIEMVRD